MIERVNINAPYFYLYSKDGRFEVGMEHDMGTYIDTYRLKEGNYFASFSEAAEYRDFVNDLLRERHA